MENINLTINIGAMSNIRAIGIDLAKEIYGASEQWLMEIFSECFIHEEGYVFVDDFLL